MLWVLNSLTNDMTMLWVLKNLTNDMIMLWVLKSLTNDMTMLWVLKCLTNDQRMQISFLTCIYFIIKICLKLMSFLFLFGHGSTKCTNIKKNSLYLFIIRIIHTHNKQHMLHN